MADKLHPKTFFLNEQHELSRGEGKGAFGRSKYVPIDWGAKAAHLSAAMGETRKALQRSRDPLRDRKYFLIAVPESSVRKYSDDKKKAPTGEFDAPVDYQGDDSRVFRKLGIDLLGVSDSGVATIHATQQRFEQLFRKASSLSEVGSMEQARWATIAGFAPIPEDQRVDRNWLSSLPPNATSDVLVELQPLLTAAEADDVLRTIKELLRRGTADALVGSGTDFSGRQWYRGNLTRSGVGRIARNLYSVQSLHSPIQTELMAPLGVVGTKKPIAQKVTIARDLARLPVVAVFDSGIPKGHEVLGPYCRAHWSSANADGVVGEHGTKVASCAVFGDVGKAGPAPAGDCRFLDVNVAEEPDSIETKAVLPAMETVFTSFPDVRVYNCSFGSADSAASWNSVEQREQRINMRDLDNFIFARDVLVVVAAGNSPPLLRPENPYPKHLDDPNWLLGSWAMGFNTLTCGSFVGQPSPKGLVKEIGWPSPFSRVGPGIAGAPIPDYSAPGGDATANYSYADYSGVWLVTSTGHWEDSCGTSFATPLLAREAAIALTALQQVCDKSAKPFGVAVKAFLALSARHVATSLPREVQELANLTLGRGMPSARRLAKPEPDSAVFLWQGVLETSKDLARIQIPVPKDWLHAAGEPRLRLVWAWDPPVNDAVLNLWSCRKVTIHLKPDPDGKTLRPQGKGAHRSHPLVERLYDISPGHLDECEIQPQTDTWIVEAGYQEIADYYPAFEFSPQQRVAFAAELFDAAEAPESPQPFIQKLPIAASMTRLGVLRTEVSSPVLIKRRR